jgi:hypothetical protein
MMQIIVPTDEHGRLLKAFSASRRLGHFDLQAIDALHSVEVCEVPMVSSTHRS